MIPDQGRPDFPIVKVTTNDGYTLHGFFSPVNHTNLILLHTHGTGGNFYGNDFYGPINRAVNKSGISFLATNNRGSGIYELENGLPPSGISLEIFEDCLKDLDTWIEFALKRGAKSVILEGHSFGIGKVAYYMAKGKYKDMVNGVIFLGTHGVFQTQEHYLKSIGMNPEVYLQEAQSLIASGKPIALLKDLKALAGYYPASAQTYVNFFTPGSNMFKSTMMASKSRGGYRHEIKVPLLWILGNEPKDEYLFVPFEEAFKLVRAENPQIEINQLACDHGLHGKEEEAASIIAGFIPFTTSKLFRV